MTLNTRHRRTMLNVIYISDSTICVHLSIDNLTFWTTLTSRHPITSGNANNVHRMTFTWTRSRMGCHTSIFLVIKIKHIIFSEKCRSVGCYTEKSKTVMQLGSVAIFLFISTTINTLPSTTLDNIHPQYSMLPGMKYWG